ncbi:hypothetical protein D047_4988B, partial [Vibrio parahaemolyticus VPTS-2010_2]
LSKKLCRSIIIPLKEQLSPSWIQTKKKTESCAIDS